MATGQGWRSTGSSHAGATPGISAPAAPGTATQEPLVILIVADSAPDAELFERELQQAGLVVRAQRVARDTQLLAQLDPVPDLILVAAGLPGLDPLHVLRLLRDRELDLPVLVVADSASEEHAVTCLKQGATDYLLKDRLGRLGLAAQRAVAERQERAAKQRTEAALREAEARYRTLIEQLPAITYVATSTTPPRTVYVSPQIERLLGFTPAEWLANPTLWLERLHPDDREHVLSGSGHALTTGEPFYREYRMLARDGRVVWGHNALVAVADPGGAAPLLQGVWVDISERKQAEQKLARLNRLYAVLSEISSATVRLRERQPLLAEACRIAVEHGGFRMAWIGWVEPETGRVTPLAAWGVGAELVEQTRVSAGDEPEGRGPTGEAIRTGQHVIIDDLAHDERVAPWREQLLQRGYRATGAFPIRVRGQTLGVLVVQASEPGFFDAEEVSVLDRLVANLAVAIEAIAADEQLRVQKSLLECQNEASLDGITVITDDGQILSMNRRCLELWHLPDEVLATRSRDVAFRAQLAHVADPEWLERRNTYLYEHPDEVSRDELLLKDGRVIDRYSGPVKDAAGTYYGRLWLFRDITEHRRLETQLRQAQKLEAIGQLAGGIAHDFNNLMTVVTGSSELLLYELGAHHPLRTTLEEIRQAGERATGLTRQLLAFSRQQVLAPQVLQLNELVSSIERLLGRLLREDITVRTVLAPQLGPVRVDPTQIEQVLLNLTINARDAMPTGGWLTIATSNVELDAADAWPTVVIEPGPYALLTVSDTGVGMDRTTQARIFEPFFTTKEPGQGTGLGLATVYGIVKQHGGYIWVSSEPGHGTTFKVYLPQVQEAIGPARETNAHTMPTGAETVLLVEDDPWVRRFAQELLELGGYRVLVATQGEEALQVAAGYLDPIHLLLTDVVLPQLSGPQVAEHLSSRRPELKVLYMSGYTDDMLVHPGVREPGTALLPKPLTPSRLLQKVREVLAAPPARPAPPTSRACQPS